MKLEQSILNQLRQFGFTLHGDPGVNADHASLAERPSASSLPTGTTRVIAPSDGSYVITSTVRGSGASAAWYSTGSCATLADRPSAATFGKGALQVDNITYQSNGTSWTAPDGYKGVIASRCGTFRLFSGTNGKMMSRSFHRATDDITALSCLFANWYTDISLGEPGLGGTATLTASIEYPAGTVHRLYFNNGSVSRVMADGETVETDELSIEIPKGAGFWVRSYFVSETGLVYTRRSLAYLNPNLESCSYGPYASSIGDKTGNANSVANTDGSIYKPIAILGRTTRNSVMLVGDSRVEGQISSTQYDTQTDSIGATGILERTFALQNLGIINCGLSGQRVAHLITAGHYTKRAALAQYVSHVAIAIGINDISDGSKTAAQLVTDSAAVNALFGGKPIIWSTISPRSTSTDSWATEVNQTPNANDAERLSFNDAIRKGDLSANGFIELAELVESSTSPGVWKAGYTADGIHENNVAGNLIQKSNLFTL